MSRRSVALVRSWMLVGAVSALLAGCSGRDAGRALQAEPRLAEPQPLQPARISVAALPSGPDCNIEFLNLQPLAGGALHTDSYSDYIVAGWVIDVVTGTDGSPVRLHVIDVDRHREWVTAVARRLPRPDVVAAQGGFWRRAWVYANAGFQATIPLEALSPGKYELAAEYQSGDGRRACGRNTTFVVD